MCGLNSFANRQYEIKNTTEYKNKIKNEVLKKR